MDLHINILYLHKNLNFILSHNCNTESLAHEVKSSADNEKCQLKVKHFTWNSKAEKYSTNHFKYHNKIALTILATCFEQTFYWAQISI